jgi:hypothetical protein
MTFTWSMHSDCFMTGFKFLLYFKQSVFSKIAATLFAIQQILLGHCPSLLKRWNVTSLPLNQGGLVMSL